MKKTESGKIILEDLCSNVYEHPAEKEIQKAVTGNPAVEKLFGFIGDNGIERWVLSQYIANSIEVKPTNFPELDNIKTEICQILDVKTPPRMYIQDDSNINCEAIGIGNPIVILNTGALEKLEKEELYFIIGHEIAQIKSQHTRYLFLHEILPMLSTVMSDTASVSLIPFAGVISNMISGGLGILLYRYERITDYTADRAALLTCQNMSVAFTTLMKISGYPATYYKKMNQNDFIKQFDDFDDSKTSNKILDVMANYDKRRPNSVRRAKELYDWFNTKEHEKILALDYSKAEQAAPVTPNPVQNNPNYTQSANIGEDIVDKLKKLF